MYLFWRARGVWKIASFGRYHNFRWVAWVTHSSWKSTGSGTLTWPSLKKNSGQNLFYRNLVFFGLTQVGCVLLVHFPLLTTFSILHFSDFILVRPSLFIFKSIKSTQTFMSGRSQFYPLFWLFQNRIFYSMGESGWGGGGGNFIEVFYVTKNKRHQKNFVTFKLL